MFDKEIIINSFPKKDKKKVWIPEEVLQSDFSSKEYIKTWIHKSGHLGFIFIKHDGVYRGLLFERNNLEDTNRVCMCDLCFSVYPATQIASFSYRISKQNFKSNYFCSELNCSEKIYSKDTNNVHSMRETLSKEDRVIRYKKNILKYF